VTDSTTADSDRLKVISVSSSSKKSGKSTVASLLVRELGADYGLKVSSGGSHAGQGLVDDPAVIEKPGTDTGALIRAGAKSVLWVSAPPSELREELEKALARFPAGGLVVVEGNSALSHFSPDFAVFLMTVPFEEFKPSAAVALAKADLVLVNLSGKLSGADTGELERLIHERSPYATVIVYHDEDSFGDALAEMLRLARSRVAPEGCD
jgi:molybdopterin-guanine dinucleotide biosynthesis protein